MTTVTPPDPIAPPLSGPRRWAATAGIALLLAAGYAGLPSPQHLDTLSRDTCLAIVPALEADGLVEILAVGPAPDRRGDVRIDYRTEDAARPRTTTITCRFGEISDTGGRGLVGVHTAEGPLSIGRLFALRRFWLTDRAALAEGLGRLRFAEVPPPAARPHGFTWVIVAAVVFGLVETIRRRIHRRRTDRRD